MRTRGPAVMGFRGYRSAMRSKDHHSAPSRPRVVSGAPSERLWQTGAMSDQVDLYKRAMAEFDRRVQAIQPSQWGSQTACSEWDVRALVRHLVYENVWVPPLFEGETIAQ